MERETFQKIMNSYLFFIALQLSQNLLQMKKLFFLLIFVLFCFSASTQEQYTINGETLVLKTEAKGAIDLLWTITDREFRYFIKKDGNITELKNTKGSTKKFQEEYKVILNNLTKGSELNTSKVKFTLYSLRNLINEYNSSQDPNYVAIKDATVQSILLIFGGVSNSPLISNPDNISTPLFGAEIEVFEATNLPSHSIYFKFQHRFQRDSFKNSQTQFGVGYRFRFLNKKTFSFYANILAATYSFNKQTVTFLDSDVLSENEISRNGFSAPFIFGVGVDFKVSDHSFIALTYNELFALLLENKGNFSTHFALGYKFKL